MSMTTELAQRMKAAALKAKHAGEAPIMHFDERISALNEFQLTACPTNVVNLVEALEKAQQAANINNWWKPDVCPITGRRFFMWIEHPELGNVPTYGGPFDSYTIPTKDSNGEFNCERYDHDVGDWVDGEYVGVQIVSDEEEIVTGSILREAEARGVEKFVVKTAHQLFSPESNAAQGLTYLACANEFVKQLREGKAE